MTDVPMTFVENVMQFEDVDRDERGSMFRKDLPPAAACWSGRDELSRLLTLDFTCPCGCGRVHALPVHAGEKLPGYWLWNGSTDKPTLTPSILATVGCRWHGFLTDGIFKPC